ncbi:MAG: TerB N-terminal domain-containing protein [Roseibacillus sp.]
MKKLGIGLLAILLLVVAGSIDASLFLLTFVVLIVGGIVFEIRGRYQRHLRKQKARKIYDRSRKKRESRKTPPQLPQLPQRTSRPTPQTERTEDNIPLQWVPFEQSTRIQGYKINGGFYAVSNNSVDFYEPSAITANDKVASPAPADQFSSSYYPSYAYLTPAEKASYLLWLKEGLVDPQPLQRNHGYVFIYFYGLERRALYEQEDIAEVIKVGMHLLATYGPAKPKRSFVSYSSEFLHFLGTRLTPESYRSLWPSLLPLHPEKVSENVLSFVTGNLATLEEPLTSELAYLIAQQHDDSRRSVVISRTGEKFRQLFEAKFNQGYPDGLPLKGSKREKKIRYQTANASLTPRMMSGSLPSDAFQATIPNVFGIKSQFRKLPQIWNECIDELFGYSRTVQKLKQAHSPNDEERLAAWLQLPRELRTPQECPLYSSFQSLLATSPSEDLFITVPCEAICVMLGIPERTTLTAKQTGLLADFVDSMGYGISPNPSLLNLSLRWQQIVALHPKPLNESYDHQSLVGLLKLLYLNILMAAADGEVSEEELDFFHQARATVELSESQNMELDATKAALLADTKLALKNLNRLSKSIPPENRPGVFHYLIKVAAADEVITSDERALLLRIQKAFELPENTLEDALADDLEFRTVQVQKGKKKSKGEPIPAPPQKKETKPEFTLDTARIEELTQETKEVVAALSTLFSEEDESAEEEQSQEGLKGSHPPSPEWMGDLSPSLAQLLTELLAIESPASSDLDRLAKSHHIMPSAFCDEINEWSDEALGDFLVENNSDGSLTIYRDLIPDS